MKYKFKNGGVVKLQNAWTTIPTFEDAFNRAFARKTAIKEAEQKATEDAAKQGGILKGQSGLEKVPTKNDKPKELISVKESKSQTPPVLPKEYFMDKLRKRWAEIRNEIKRPNAFGKFVITREGTKVVDDGGKIA